MDLIKRAAKVTGMSVPDYCRWRFVPVAAKDAGETMIPFFPPFGPGRPTNQPAEVVAAAQRLGVSPEEFVQRVLKAAVEGALKVGSEIPPGLDIPAPPPRQ